MIAARASSITFLTRASVSLAKAPSRAGSAVASRDLNTACAAARRRFGSGASRVRLPIAASTERRRRLLRRTVLRPAACLAGDRLAGGGVEDLARGLAHIDLLGFGIEQQAAVLQGADDRDRQRIAAGRDGGDGRIGVAEGIAANPASACS